MIVDTETAAWLSFAGWAFVLMGVSLAADARGHAASSAEWEGGGATPAAAYRAAGAAFIAMGAVLAAATWMRPAALGALARPIHLRPLERCVAGFGLAALGAGLALHRLTLEAPRRLPAALAAEDPGAGVPAPLSRRAASWAAWLLSVEFLLFGCFLLSRRGGFTP